MSVNSWRRGITLLFLCSLLIIPYASHAQIQQVTFTLDGTGSLLESPVIYSGWITSGPLEDGWFTIHIDDTGWPPDTDKAARWNYIVSTYFTYDAEPGGEHWDGYFPLYGTQFPVVTWHFMKDPDQLGGVLRYLLITISDDDHDGVIDQDELATQAIAGNFHCHIEQNTGAYEGWCGHVPGSGNGTLSNFDPYLPDIITISYGNLFLRNYNCSVPVEEQTWGAVKSIYSE